MSALQSLPPAVIALLPLSLATGVDLYLTIFLVGALPATSWGAHALPGALGELHAPAVLIMVGGFYLLEAVVERWPVGALSWNAFHAAVRPLAGALLALLLLEGQPLWIAAPGVVLGAAITFAVHAVRSGQATLLWLTDASSPRPLFLSALEDVGVLGLLVLLLAHPPWAAAASAAVILAALPAAGSSLRAFAFAVRLTWGRVWSMEERTGWTDGRDLPRWLQRTLTANVSARAGVRGSRAAAYRLTGAARFVTGWVVVLDHGPSFVLRTRPVPALVELGHLGASGIEEGSLFRSVDLGRDDRGRTRLYFGLNGPGSDALESAFPAV